MRSASPDQARDFTKEQVTAAENMLASAGTEAQIRDHLTTLLRTFDAEPQLEYDTGNGPADVVCIAERVVIETKRDLGDPNSHLPQLRRYMEALAAPSLLQTVQDGWWGLITDGRVWYREYRTGAGRSEHVSRMVLTGGRGRELLVWLRGCFTRSGLPPIPDDPYRVLFRPLLTELADIAAGRPRFSRSAERAFGTQQRLWADMLAGSGMVPAGGSDTELFVRHTFLVAVARAVIDHLADRPSDDAGGHGGGFMSWVTDVPYGDGWLNALAALVGGYDWRAKPRDVLRSMYESVIDKPQRKAFGEYYTPDWLAGMICEQVLDNEWCERAVRAAADGTNAGVGVLDPTCGSGTFLFHAARQLTAVAAAQGFSEQQTTDLVAALVHGIDIHPVAVEFAKATLLRALPATPAAGSDGLQVYQGDTLLASGRDRGGLFRTGHDGYEIDTPGGRAFTIPKGLTVDRPGQPRLGQRIRQLVDSACRADSRVPVSVTVGLSPNDRALTETAHQVLVDVVRAEGNGVWAWYIINQIAPILLSERKVDRVIANPPWVRMSDIQAESRKRTLEQLAVSDGLWPGGRNATGFDIAALFVKRCHDLYVTDSEAAGGWVVNQASLRGGNWGRFRDWAAERDASWIDLGDVRPRPFSGANSAVWWIGGKHPPNARLVNNPDQAAPAAGVSWAGMGKHTQTVGVVEFPKRPSAYQEVPRQGATLVPYCLVRVGTAEPCGEGRIRVTTVRSRQKPWKDVGTLAGDVPAEWVTDCVFSTDLLPYHTEPATPVVIPRDSTGGLSENAHAEPFWQEADQLWDDYRGRGRATPRTLLDQINYQNKLATQLDAHSGWVVVYNSSGKWLRAARTQAPIIVNHNCYRLDMASAEEAAYLVALLNADILQPWYQASRRSDRHFLLHPWRWVPIPKYDPDNPAHQRLVALCEQAETHIATLVTAGMEGGQPKRSETIRTMLRQSGVYARIDQAAADVVPVPT